MHPDPRWLHPGWFAVRCVFEVDPRHREETALRIYEERITIWPATTPDEAIAQAEAEAHTYAETVECSYLGLAQAYELAEVPGPGAEVYSLMRDSHLDPNAYLDRFFDTGHERQRR
jgi:hypothetical protein